MNDLTISPEGLDRETLLSDWSWAMEEPMMPVLLTAMGDVFAQGQSGAVYFVDVACGTVERVASDGSQFQSILRDESFVTEKMHPARIVELRNAGLALGPGEVYSYRQPLVLGGDDELENFEMTNVAVHLSIHGQIHHQVKDLPPGTPIGDVKIE
jgi:hypothetical protein